MTLGHVSVLKEGRDILALAFTCTVDPTLCSLLLKHSPQNGDTSLLRITPGLNTSVTGTRSPPTPAEGPRVLPPDGAEEREDIMEHLQHPLDAPLPSTSTHRLISYDEHSHSTAYIRLTNIKSYHAAQVHLHQRDHLVPQGRQRRTTGPTRWTLEATQRSSRRTLCHTGDFPVSLHTGVPTAYPQPHPDLQSRILLLDPLWQVPLVSTGSSKSSLPNARLSTSFLCPSGPSCGR